MNNRGFQDIRLPRFVSYVVLLLFAAVAGYVVYLQKHPPTHPPHVSKVPSDLRSLTTAIEAYFVDHQSYPPMRLFREETWIDQDVLRASGGWNLSMVEPGDEWVVGLTTPVAYYLSLPGDAFAPCEGMTYIYYTDGKGYLLFSAGPDRDYDLVPETDYNGEAPLEALITLHQKRYDPTNGTISNGDYWRVSNP